MCRRSLLGVGLGALAAAGVPGCSTGTSRLPRLVLGTGPQGGPYKAFGQALAAAAKTRGLALEPVATSASVDNLRRLHEGGLQLALTTADVAEDAVLGRNTFTRPLRLTALARVYVNYTHLVVAAKGPVHAIGDLSRQPVSVGATGAGGQVLARRLLRAAGLTGTHTAHERSMSLGASLRALRTGAVRAVFWSGGVPTPALADLAGELPLRLVPLDAYVLRLREEYGPTYTEVTIPAGTYALKRPVATVGTGNYLVARQDVPADAAHRLLEVLFDRSQGLLRSVTAGARLEPRFAISTGSVPLHPGAVEYYRSVYG
ncbi:TAXI family TRAP transporter solute-binding subunit [Wenjunlia tyrosinilytica]|uniref:C4-dicarboxylate ABC transporter substrate-binding protein n=1 Tax=Wenjunlia tyrosinilytica TaxID=1544741 RepID=A0A917ZX49_9ACTN|nr:TAXI family TRAP transporter solute-binding subunit [Wenjunlia tyrosinilytica]GGO97878.1 C4-dicarboxylate ABC transporter substrate-binding protein [Wenjunlia tyrosinilytica]